MPEPWLQHREHLLRLATAQQHRIAQDKEDVKKNLQRERWFTVKYSRMSRNKLWSAKQGPECPYYNESPEDYTHHQKIWPRGRHLHEINLYSQLYDFYRFMWSHTRPYKTVAVIVIMSIARPFQVAATSYVVQYIERNPQTAPLWLYFFNFYGYACERFLFWFYQLWVPLNSQRVQLRSVLLKQRSRLPLDHPVAYKWPSGRFIGLLKDVDEVINGVWQSMLDMFDGLVTMIYLVILCCANLAVSAEKSWDRTDYGTYISLFLALGVLTMTMPFVWFHLFDSSVQECEHMVRAGQALYMSASQGTLSVKENLYQTQSEIDGLLGNEEDPNDHDSERQRSTDSTAVQSFWLYGRTTFRSYFHRLAWETNYGLFTYAWTPLVEYFLLTKRGFAASFGTANIMIVLISLQDLIGLSAKLLQYLIKMSRGCNVLRDVAEILNANVEEYDSVDIEKGIVFDVKSIGETNNSHVEAVRRKCADGTVKLKPLYRN